MCNFLCLIYFTVFCVSEVLKFYVTEVLVKPREDGECDITQLRLESEPNSERLASSFDLFVLLSSVDYIQRVFLLCLTQAEIPGANSSGAAGRAVIGTEHISLFHPNPRWQSCDFGTDIKTSYTVEKILINKWKMMLIQQRLIEVCFSLAPKFLNKKIVF